MGCECVSGVNHMGQVNWCTLWLVNVKGNVACISQVSWVHCMAYKCVSGVVCMGCECDRYVGCVVYCEGCIGCECVGYVRDGPSIIGCEDAKWVMDTPFIPQTLRCFDLGIFAK